MRNDPPDGTRAAIGVFSIRLVAAAVLVSITALMAPSHMLAVGNTLSNGSVDPTTGTIATVFAFQVDYTSPQGFDAASLWADVAGTTVGLVLVSGVADDGTFSGSSSLPAGSWPVTFRADAIQGSDPTLAGPTLTVIDPNATPPPTPVPPPAPPTNPPPTPAPTPPPDLPAPTLPPSETVAPGVSTPSTPGASSATSPATSGQPSSAPMASGVQGRSPEPSAGEPDPSGRSGNPWLFVGGGMSAMGAAILAGHWAGRRRRRRPTRP